MNDDYGDELEYEIIISKGYDEAEDFGDGLNPAKWLNPPKPVRENNGSS